MNDDYAEILARVQAGDLEHAAGTGEAVYNKLRIAREYIELAMQCYMARQKYFCAIHLAGAAEELLGGWLRPEDRIQTKAIKAQKAMQTLETGKTPSDRDVARRLNWAKNTLKHMDEPQVNIYLDPVLEARDHIANAMINYSKVGLPETNTMFEFGDYRSREIAEECKK